MGGFQYHYPAWIHFDDLSLVIRSTALRHPDRLDCRNTRRKNKILYPCFYFLDRSGCAVHLFTAGTSQYAQGLIEHHQHNSNLWNVPVAYAQEKSVRIASIFSPLKYSTIISSSELPVC